MSENLIIRDCVLVSAPKDVTHVTVPDEVYRIGNSAFEDCKSLRSIALPDGLLEIGDGAFCDCTSLCEIELPVELREIGKNAFRGCTSLEKISLPEALEKLDWTAFDACPKLVVSVYINDLAGWCRRRHLSFLQEFDLYLCGEKLTELTIPPEVDSLGYYVFSNCRHLTSVLFPAESSTRFIGDGAFHNCKQLTSVTFADSLEYISTGAFEGCSSLKELSLPDKTKIISAKAFSGCTSLTTVRLPADTDYVAEELFCGCASLKSIQPTGNIYYVCERAFYGCASLVDFDFSSIKTVKEKAFSGCKSLTSVTLPSDRSKICESAFDSSLLFINDQNKHLLTTAYKFVTEEKRENDGDVYVCGYGTFESATLTDKESEELTSLSGAWLWLDMTEDGHDYSQTEYGLGRDTVIEKNYHHLYPANALIYKGELIGFTREPFILLIDGKAITHIDEDDTRGDTIYINNSSHALERKP